MLCILNPNKVHTDGGNQVSVYLARKPSQQLDILDATVDNSIVYANRQTFIIALIGEQILLYRYCHGRLPYVLAGGLLLAAIVLLALLSNHQVTHAADCSQPLQELIDRAAPGAVVHVPPCIYRETVVIDKPLTLEAEPGAEIRGSDVWTGWQRVGSLWVHGGAPDFPQEGWCSPGYQRCAWPHQVFYDGKPLLQVAPTQTPQKGQFKVSGGKIFIADDPVGHTIEVTTRTQWVVGKADHVTIRGFVMRHSASNDGLGAIANNSHSWWTLENNKLLYAHNAAVMLYRGSGHRVVNNEIAFCGKMGLGARQISNSTIEGNRIHDNNTEMFHPQQVAAGMKTVILLNSVIRNNNVYSNNSPGIWCDLDCQNVTIVGNRVHDNKWQGIWYELSSSAKIYDNVVWSNGWSHIGWGWGAGILVHNSKRVEVYHNTVAWNRAGIWVKRQDRRGSAWHDPNWNHMFDIYIHDNWIISDSNKNNPTASGWSDSFDGDLFNPANNNRGYHNLYWYPTREGLGPRFAWKAPLATLASYNRTPGEESARYMSDSEKAQVLDSAHIPAPPDRTAPIGRVVIADGRGYTKFTTVSITVAATDPAGVALVRVSNIPDSKNGLLAYAKTSGYSPNMQWSLTNTAYGGSNINGKRTVYVQWMDKLGNWSNIYSDQIFLDTKAPIGAIHINSGDKYTKSRYVLLSATARDPSPGSGAYRVRFSNNARTWSEWRQFSGSMSIKWTLIKGQGTRTVYAQYRDRAGNVLTTKDSILLDSMPPYTYRPWVGFVRNTPAASGVPFKVGWREATDPAPASGVDRYIVQVSVNDGKWQSVDTTSGRSLPFTGSSGKHYRFRVRAIDHAGNAGAYAYGTTFMARRIEDGSANIRYIRTWSKGSTSRYASTRGAAMVMRFWGTDVAWIATKGPNRGKAAVYLDGVRVAVVNLYSSQLRGPSIVYAWSWDELGSHSIEIRVLGTHDIRSKGNRVDIDALLTLK